jgi:hypothetical protein
MSLNSERGMAKLSLPSRSGRKRKQGRRTASGATAREPATNYRALAGMQPHRNWLPAAMRESEKAATLLGALNLLYRPATQFTPEFGITDQQAEAGRQYAVAVGRYRASIGSPSSMGGTGRGYACNPSHCYSGDNLDGCECLKRRRRYNDLYDTLRAMRDRDAMQAVNDTAIRELRPHDIHALRRGLNVLVQHLGLT